LVSAIAIITNSTLDLPSSQRNPVVEHSILTSSIEERKRQPPTHATKPKESILKKAKTNQLKQQWPPVYTLKGTPMEVEGSPRSIRGSSTNIISSPPPPPANETLTSSPSQITRPSTQRKFIVESSSPEVPSISPPSQIARPSSQRKYIVESSSLEVPSISPPILFPNTPLPLSSSETPSTDKPQATQYEAFEQENTLQQMDEGDISEIFNKFQIHSQEKVEDAEDVVVGQMRIGLCYQASEYIYRVMLLYSRYKRVTILDEVDIGMQDIINLYDGNWIPELIVECYIARLRRVEQDQYHILSGGALNKWMVMKPEKVYALTRPHILIPICWNSHWIIAVLVVEQQLIHIYDSNQLSGTAEYYRTNYLHRVWRGIFVKYEIQADNWEVTSIDTAQQTDGSSCGVFVMRRMKALITNTTVRPFGDAAVERNKVLWEILFGLLQ